MNDKFYRRLQFRYKISNVSGIEFQTLFENVMREYHGTDFQPIRPYGAIGDGGNDGFIPIRGEYFQVYSPVNPVEKEMAAALKMKRDFRKVLENWNNIKPIQIYNFVYNDKRQGVSKVLMEMLSELENSYPSIVFKLFSPEDLEQKFLKLTEDQILILGFNTDTRQAFLVARSFIATIEQDFDRGDISAVFDGISRISESLNQLGDPFLSAEILLLEAQSLQKRGEIAQAIIKHEEFIRLYPTDPRPLLYLAEIELNRNNMDKNLELIEKAEKLENDHWLLGIQNLIRGLVMNNSELGDLVDESSIVEQRQLSDYYRLYALHFEPKDNSKAKSYIAKAISLNPNKFINHYVNLNIEFNNLNSKQREFNEFSQSIDSFISKLDSVSKEFNPSGELTAKDQARLNILYFNANLAKRKFRKAISFARKVLELLYLCNFDRVSDIFFSNVLKYVQLTESDLESLCNYLESQTGYISRELTLCLFFQFNGVETLDSKGRAFFTRMNMNEVVRVIDGLGGNDVDLVAEFLLQDDVFAVKAASEMKGYPDLRKKMIASLEKGKITHKAKLLLLMLLNYDEGDVDKAYAVVEGFDFDDLSSFEAAIVLDIVIKKEAWEFAAVLLKKLLKNEVEGKEKSQYKWQLCRAYLELGQFPEAYQLGKEILSSEEDTRFISDENKELLLLQLIQIKLNRGESKEVKLLLESNLELLRSPDSIISAKANVYLELGDARAALDGIVEGIVKMDNPLPEQYGRLFPFFLTIGKLIDFDLTSQKQVTNGSFVKLADNDRWYSIDAVSSLDAIKVSKGSAKYQAFIQKSVGDEINIEKKYSNDKFTAVIENILPLERYIHWQSIHNFQKLSKEGDWDLAQVVEVKQEGESIDLDNVQALLDDSMGSREFFNSYAVNNFPLAMLATNEGGIINAIGRIVNEDKGFIRSSRGDIDEIMEQRNVIKEMIDKKPYLISGEAALFLAESGFFNELIEHVPNIYVPQSVVNLLIDLRNKNQDKPGVVGRMTIQNGEVIFRETNEESNRAYLEKINKVINYFESNGEKIQVISNGSKENVFSEQNIASALCDGCLLAQRNEWLLLTDDFLYLDFNKLETGKTQPPYASTYALVKELYDQRLVDFDTYSRYFYYLASYRHRFLPIMSNDLENAVFGVGDNKGVFQPDRINIFIPKMTLSEEYGVPFEVAFKLIILFLIQVLRRDGLTTDMFKEVFTEVISAFPSNKPNHEIGGLLLAGCYFLVNEYNQEFASVSELQEKLNVIEEVVKEYSTERNIE